MMIHEFPCSFLLLAGSKENLLFFLQPNYNRTCKMSNFNLDLMHGSEHQAPSTKM